MLESYINLFNVFYRKSLVLKPKGLSKYSNENLLAFWVKIYRCDKLIAVKKLPKTIVASGFYNTIRLIYKPVFFELLSDIKKRFPKSWNVLKRLVDKLK
jgi:hypothetical protein